MTRPVRAHLRAGALAAVLAAAATPVLVAAPALAQESAAQSQFQATTLNLSAYGETRLAPDMATISLGVSTEAATAAAALQANSAQMTKVIAALKKGGILDKDIQTSGLSLNAVYDYPQNETPKLRGYQVSNQVTVRVMDLKKLGAAVDATVGAGANQVNGISFGVSDPTAAENAARQAAARALGAKANLYAAATGYRVQRLISLSESGGYSPPAPMPLYAMARMEKADSTPVAPGEVTIRADVSAVYELVK